MVRSNEGFQVQYIHYWCDEFKSRRWWGRQVPVRYDPFNIDVAYAYLDHSWVRCRSKYSYLLRYRTEKEVQVATEVTRDQRRQGQRAYNSEQQLGEFLRSAADIEAVMTERWRALENAQIHAAINGDVSPPPSDFLGISTDGNTSEEPQETHDVPTSPNSHDVGTFPEY
jgi:hypothetical protein